ncbi:hypothetical protein [Fontivita pretiosa]|uniref:hypothetical protein n=1 Tax=Fontivita pretiosa TaxID=2989684 RepID=UPI003D17C747
MRWIGASPRVVLGWAIAATLIAAVVRAGDAPEAKTSVCEQAQTLLGIPNQGEQLLGALADLWPTLPKAESDGPFFYTVQMTGEQMERVARVVHAGVRPNLIRDELWSAYPANSFPASPAQVQKRNRVYGPHGADYLAVAYSLWREAVRVVDSDPAKAQRLARTAAVLCIQPGDATSSAMALDLVREPQSHRVLGLSEPQHRALMELARSRYCNSGEYHQWTLGLSKAIDELIAAPAGSKLDRSRLESALDHFRAIWISSGEAIQDRWANAGYLWRLVCLARAEGDAEALALIRNKLDELDGQSHDPNSRRWLKEIMTLPGGRPSPIGLGKVPTLSECKPPSP